LFTHHVSNIFPLADYKKNAMHRKTGGQEQHQPWEVTPEKPSIASMVCAVAHSSREKPT